MKYWFTWRLISTYGVYSFLHVPLHLAAPLSWPLTPLMESATYCIGKEDFSLILQPLPCPFSCLLFHVCQWLATLNWSVSAVPTKSGCGDGGGLPAKHVAVMSIYTCHNLHCQNPRPANIYWSGYKNRCCALLLFDNSVVITTPWIQIEMVKLRLTEWYATGGETQWRDLCCISPNGCGLEPEYQCFPAAAQNISLLIHSVQMSDIIAFVSGAHSICDTIYVKHFHSSSTVSQDLHV